MGEKRIVLGVTGGIAAYKMPNLASALSQSGYTVTVMMTPGAEKFITPLSFEAVTHVPCVLRDDERLNNSCNQHIRLGTTADLILVAPATANTLAKMAHGIADNIVTETVLAATCSVAVAPAMNTNMLNHPATRENLAILRRRGVHVIEPATGMLACQTSGAGRLPETETLRMAVEHLLHPKDMQGYHVLVNAGPTREALDPVRFLTNGSTGKMGYAVAAAAARRGADVTLISGPSNETVPYGVRCIRVKSAAEMFEAVAAERSGQDFIVLTAAVADYRPVTVSDEKIKKSSDKMQLTLERTADILRYVCTRKLPGQKICGFAMETSNLVDNARKKLIEKGADLMVANSLKTAGAGFGTDTNAAVLIGKDMVREVPLTEKLTLADIIWDELTGDR